MVSSLAFLYLRLSCGRRQAVRELVCECRAGPAVIARCDDIRAAPIVCHPMRMTRGGAVIPFG